MKGALFGLLLLALSLIKTLFLRLLPKRALEKFEHNYVGDNLSCPSKVDYQTLAQAGRCTACGRCDRYEGERIRTSDGRYRGLMHLALTGSRSLPDFAAVARSIQGLDDEVFLRGESLCPMDVPLLDLAKLVRNSSPNERRDL